jgi:tetratricopeptide (TPR) repeat protein
MIKFLLEKYLEIYKKNRQSKVFAPLADIYRKLGMFEEAIRILKEGLKHNPEYSLAHLNLALCYLDLERYQLAYDVLRPLLEKNPENISMHRAFAESCLRLNQAEEASFYFEYLSFLCPKNDYFKEKAQEAKIEHKRENREVREVPKLNSSSTSPDDWSDRPTYSLKRPLEQENIKEKQDVTNKEKRFKSFLKKIQDRTLSP